MVCTTQYPNVLVKVSKRPSSDPRTQSWHSHIQWISRQALEGLHIAAPRALIVKPRLGYVMELMDGLESLKPILDKSLQAMQGGYGLKGFMDSGGVSIRYGDGQHAVVGWTRLRMKKRCEVLGLAVVPFVNGPNHVADQSTEHAGLPISVR